MTREAGHARPLRPGSRNRRAPGEARRAAGRGFTMLEITLAFAVLSVVVAVLIQMVTSSRAVARRVSDMRLASSVAQGALERLRASPPEALAYGEVALGLPPEAAGLLDGRMSATVAPWRGEASGDGLGQDLRHIRIVLSWRPRTGVLREIVREGLASDSRER